MAIEITPECAECGDDAAKYFFIVLGGNTRDYDTGDMEAICLKCVGKLLQKEED